MPTDPIAFADLSVLPTEDDTAVAEAHDDQLPSPGPGPVRRRKTSLRSNPIGRAPSPPPLPAEARLLDVMRDAAGADMGVEAPRTPVQPGAPAPVRFHALMPVVGAHQSPDGEPMDWD
jgi:hypothetical protein